ncbi:MAG TPA: protein phosphatase 2C domain-containing protein [Streptosporangiaceae bacterium]|nr:protein phosphatase 2C domain-containing protein [Streptosporangiaceae bacterium]
MPVSPQDNFCEACRTELAPAVVSGEAPENATVCAFCQSSQISADGYCESCGHKVPASRDHAEIDLGLLAGVTDRGRRHPRNEDAMALATAEVDSGPAAVAVVCDGVSSTRLPDAASLAAAQTAVKVLLARVRTGEDLIEASRDAVAAAQEAVAGLGELPGSSPWKDPPSATFVSAVMTSEAVTLCWLGDSRAYWLGAGPDPTAQRLTLDDSVAGEMVAAGMLSEADALALPQAHVVTRWVGADSGGTAPHVARFEPPGPGVLLLCSDGLWNYQPEAAKLSELALPMALTYPLRAASALVAFALEAGGADNVTAVLAPFPPRTSERHDETVPAMPAVPPDAKELPADEPA